MPQRRWTTGSLVAVSPALAACGGSDGDATPTTTATVATSAATDDVR